MSSIVASPEIQHAPKRAVRDTYRHNLIFPQTGSQSLSLNNTSSHESVFEIPSKALSLGESYLQWRMLMPEISERVNAMSCKGVCQISRISLYTRSGLYLADLPHFSAYSQTVIPVTTNYEDMRSYGMQKGGLVSNPWGTVREIGIGEDVATNSPDTMEHIIPDLDSAGSFSAMSAVALHATTGLGRSSAGDGIAHYVVAPDSGKLITNHIMKLSACKHTLLALKKTMYYPEVLLLRVQWAPCDQYAKSYSIVASRVFDSTNVASVNDVAVQALGLHLALSSDAAMSANIMANVLEKGMTIPAPYVHGAENYYSEANQSISMRANVGYGKRLLCAYHSVFSRSDNPHRHTCNNNRDGQLVDNYYTTLDSQRLQDSNLRQEFQEPYAENMKLLEGSCIRGAAEYGENAVHIDSWRAGRACDWPDMDHIEDGLILENSERTYTIFQQVPATNPDRYSYTFLIVQKELTINREGISLV